jgi:hypothetical protein
MPESVSDHESHLPGHHRPLVGPLVPMVAKGPEPRRTPARRLLMDLSISENVLHAKFGENLTGEVHTESLFS